MVARALVILVWMGRATRTCGMRLDSSTVRRFCVLVRAGRLVKVSVPQCNSELWHSFKHALASQIHAGVSASGPWAAGKRVVRQGLKQLAAAPAHNLSRTAITASEKAYCICRVARRCLCQGRAGSWEAWGAAGPGAAIGCPSSTGRASSSCSAKPGNQYCAC